jgi:hypothetical protein
VKNGGSNVITLKKKSNYVAYEQEFCVFSCHRLVLPGTTPVAPAVIPLLRLQVPDCITFCLMSDVPSVAVLCSEFNEGVTLKFSILCVLYVSMFSIIAIKCTIFNQCIHIFLPEDRT